MDGNGELGRADEVGGCDRDEGEKARERIELRDEQEAEGGTYESKMGGGAADNRKGVFCAKLQIVSKARWR